MSKSILGFKFKEECKELEIIENLLLKNNGNKSVPFNWIFREDCPFQIEPEKGEVEAFSDIKILVKYKPISPRDECNIILQVKDGINKPLKCIGNTNETKVELNTNQINFNNIPVCTKMTDIFYISNKHKKNFAYFKIEPEKLIEGLEIKPIKGRISPEDKQKFEIIFQSSIVTDIKQKKIPIEVRGSKPLNIFFSVMTLVPRVEILENSFDFGKLTYGNKGKQQLTLTNSSNIPAQLEIDLSSNNESQQERLNCLSIEHEDIQKYSIKEIIQEVDENKTNSFEKKKYILLIEPFKTKVINLLFIPMKPKSYK